MLLSAVSVLVVARSSSEIPKGLMNNPVDMAAMHTGEVMFVVMYRGAQNMELTVRFSGVGKYFELKLKVGGDMYVVPCYRGEKLIVGDLVNGRVCP